MSRNIFSISYNNLLYRYNF